jgi:hypothetical protein
MRSDIVPGGTFPDCELPGRTNVPRRLSQLQGDDPLRVATIATRLGQARPSSDAGPPLTRPTA